MVYSWSERRFWRARSFVPASVMKSEEGVHDINTTDNDTEQSPLPPSVYFVRFYGRLPSSSVMGSAPTAALTPRTPQAFLRAQDGLSYRRLKASLVTSFQLCQSSWRDFSSCRWITDPGLLTALVSPLLPYRCQKPWRPSHGRRTAEL